jgi:hypothetical protein
MKWSRYALGAVAAIAGLVVAPAESLAQECTPTGWCIQNGVNGDRIMYVYTGRSGNYAYTTEIGINPNLTRTPSFDRAYDCAKWMHRFKGTLWYDIIPGSMLDFIANDVCRRR